MTVLAPTSSAPQTAAQFDASMQALASELNAPVFTSATGGAPAMPTIPTAFAVTSVPSVPGIIAVTPVGAKPNNTTGLLLLLLLAGGGLYLFSKRKG